MRRENASFRASSLPPIRRRDYAVPEHHGLTGQPLAGLESALVRDPSLDGGRLAERSLDHLDPASGTDADAAAGVRERSAGPTGTVEKGLVFLRNCCKA